MTTLDEQNLQYCIVLVGVQDERNSRMKSEMSKLSMSNHPQFTTNHSHLCAVP